MQVNLDGSPAAFGWSGLATVGEVVERADKALALKERVVSALEIDGEGADLSDPASWSSRPTDGVKVLDLSSRTLAALVVDTLDELKAHFPRLRDELKTAAAALRSGREAEALSALARAVALWEACLAVGRDVTRGFAPEGDLSLQEQLEGLRAAIAPLEEALRRRDLALVADLCAYELPPVVDRWEEALAAWRDLAAGAP